MPNLQMKLPKRYEGDGRCLYCLGRFPPEELTDEHIIPIAIHGNVYIKNGACKPCARMSNQSYENETLNRDLQIPRVLLGLLGRSKNKKTPDVRHLPPVYKGNVALGRKRERLLDFPVELYPKVFSLMLFDPPGLLSNVDRGSELKAIRLRYFAVKGAGLSDVTSMIEFRNGPFAKTLAKIGYCYAVAERGLAAFDGEKIRSILNDKSDGVYNLVGNAASHTPLSREYLHSLYLREIDGWLVALVDLFASLRDSTGESFPYQVVVGKLR